MPAKLPFAGFPEEALQFLRDLADNNEREWFQPRKDEYERLLKNPMSDLVSALNAELARLAPRYVTDPKKSIFRIYRDTRFSKDKTPYKTHVAAWFGMHGLEDMGGAGLYLSVSPKALEIAGGIYHAPPQTLLAVRTHIAITYREFEWLLANRKLRRLLGELRGDELTRVPKGFDAAHPAAHLLKKKDWTFFSELSPEIATGPKLWKEALPRFEAMIPVLDYLNAPLLRKKPKTYQ